jgi:hypothetical protein
VSAEFLVARGLPTRESLAARPHGSRLRYLGGCRCLPCRAANSRYQCERAAARKTGGWNGLVDAAPAAAQIFRLSRLGVGYKSVADAAGVSRSIAAKIRSGERRHIRASTARRILAVDAAARADASTVPAGPTWRRIRQLLEEGYTKGRLARELGAQRPALQLGRRRVLAITAVRVERLHRRLLS